MRKVIKEILRKLSLLDYVLVFVCLIFTVLGMRSLFRGILGSSEIEIEYLNGSKTNDGEPKPVIIVDIGGAVVKSGVYELPSGSRVKDLLILAGGLSEKADREYCEKTFNMAKPLEDGQKIYIPFLTDTPTAQGYTEAKTSGRMINVNSATEGELDTLWGVGVVRVQSIVKNRPYTSLSDFEARGGVTKQIIEKNKEVITF